MPAQTKAYRVTTAFTDPKGKAWKVGDTYPAPTQGGADAQALQAAIAAGQVQEQPPEEDK